MSAANVVDSSGWLEYFTDSDRAALFSSAIEDSENLLVPVISIYEVFKKVLRERGEDDALQVASMMQCGQVIDLDCALALGLAGADVVTRRERFLALAPSFGELLLHSDAQTTLSGAHAGRPGAIVAIGTGSIGLAFGVDGSRRMSNGWGFPVGDEGSGAWLGLRSMQLAQQALDGRVATGALARAVFLVAGSNRAELLAWCEQAGQQRYATLAPLVFETEAADPQAAALLARAVLAIEQTVAAIDPAGTLPLALCGSLGRRFEPRLGAAVRARCVAPAGDAVDGALCLLRQHLDHHFARATR